MNARIWTGLLAMGFLAATLSAQTTSPAPTPPAPQPTPSVGSATSSAAPAAYTLSPEKREKAIAYASARYSLHFVSFLWSVLVLVGIIALRLAPRFRDRAESVSKLRFWQAAVFVPL